MVCVPLVPLRSVWLSPWARAASAAARLPPAPGLFSTTAGCPSTVLRRSANSRAERSALPPAGNGTRMPIVLLGQVSDEASAQLGTAAALAAAAAHPKIRRRRASNIMLSYKLGRPRTCGVELTLRVNRRPLQPARVADPLPL